MDIVYTYVNMNDTNWNTKRQMMKQLYYDPNINNIDSNTENRFIDNNELLLSIRSVEKFVSWVNKIYIVTDEHFPEWLNINHEKIIVIDHKNIIPNEFLPTFNSHVIELFLHKIPGLSETFIYLNDDVIFTKNIQYEDFVNNNKISVFLDKYYTKKGNPNVNEYAFRSAWKNSNKWLDEYFFVEKRYKMAHAPMIINKTIVNNIWDIMYDKLIPVCNQKFRSIIDYNILCSIYIYYSLYKGFAFNNDTLKCISIFDNDDLSKIYNKDCHIICLNTYSKNIFEYIQNVFLFEKSDFEI